MNPENGIPRQYVPIVGVRGHWCAWRQSVQASVSKGSQGGVGSVVMASLQGWSCSMTDLQLKTSVNICVANACSILELI